MQDDFTALTNYLLSEQLLREDWLGPDPPVTLRAELERMLQVQVPSARVDSVRVQDVPRFFLSGATLPGGQLAANRLAVALLFELSVHAVDGVHPLSGVFTWVTRDLDTARDDEVYLDLEPNFWMSYDFKLVLLERVYNSAAGRPRELPSPASELVGSSELTTPASGWPFIIQHGASGPTATPPAASSRPTRWKWKFWQR